MIRLIFLVIFYKKQISYDWIFIFILSITTYWNYRVSHKQIKYLPKLSVKKSLLSISIIKSSNKILYLPIVYF